MGQGSGPRRRMTTPHFADLFVAIGGAFGDDPALAHGERKFTWTEFVEQAQRFATYLASVGVGPGDRVGLLLYNSPEYLIAQFGAFLPSARIAGEHQLPVSRRRTGLPV